MLELLGSKLSTSDRDMYRSSYESAAVADPSSDSKIMVSLSDLEMLSLANSGDWAKLAVAVHDGLERSVGKDFCDHPATSLYYSMKARYLLANGDLNEALAAATLMLATAAHHVGADQLVKYRELNAYVLILLGEADKAESLVSDGVSRLSASEDGLPYRDFTPFLAMIQVLRGDMPQAKFLAMTAANHWATFAHREGFTLIVSVAPLLAVVNVLLTLLTKRLLWICELDHAMVRAVELLTATLRRMGKRSPSVAPIAAVYTAWFRY